MNKRLVAVIYALIMTTIFSIINNLLAHFFGASVEILLLSNCLFVLYMILYFVANNKRD